MLGIPGSAQSEDRWHRRVAGAREADTTLGAAVGLFKTGKRPPQGMLWVATCGNPRCANPAHRQLELAGRQSQIAADHGRNGGQLRVQRLRAARRANSKWSDADIAALRQDEGTITELAEKYGMSVSHCHRVLRGHGRVELGAFGIAMQQLCAEPA